MSRIRFPWAGVDVAAAVGIVTAPVVVGVTVVAAATVVLATVLLAPGFVGGAEGRAVGPGAEASGARAATPPHDAGLAATPFTPPASYARLWDEVQACSGRTGEMDRVTWHRVAGFAGRPRRLAQWEPGRTITIRDDIVVALPIVAHEMLHDLLDGDAEHQDPAWRECALPVAGAGAEAWRSRVGGVTE